MQNRIPIYLVPSLGQRAARREGRAVNPFGVLCVLLVSSCFGPPKTPTNPEEAAASTLKSCGPEGQIDDAEDNDNQILPSGERGGYWYTFLDKQGSTVFPTAGDRGGTFTMTKGGANQSGYAANIKGTIGTAETVYAGVAFNFQDPKGTYDASRYAGVTFFAKKAPNSTGKVRLKVPDANTDPDGKVCTECFNDFGFDLELSEEWTRYVIPFEKMRQLPNWGAPQPSRLDASKLYGMQFQVNAKGQTYDISIDDLAFICK